MAATIEASNLSVSTKELTMKSLAKSTVNCTNSIIISDIKIHMDAEGRYSLNDLHTAAGGEQKHKPVHWLSTQQTKDLIEEILKVEKPTFKPTDIKKGRYGGTYVCKELVYSYGMWISAEFALKVIRAYDALVSGNVNEAVRIAKTTVNERTPLRDAVNLLVGKKGLRYDDAYNMVHQRFNIDSIDELDLEQIPLAVEYVHRVALEGEFLGKQETLPAPKFDVNIPLQWWLDNNPVVRSGNLSFGKSLTAPSFDVTMEMLCGDNSTSAAIRLINVLEEAGFDVSAPKAEIVAMRKHLGNVEYGMKAIADACRRAGNKTISFRGGKAEYVIG
ncbi:KilA-N domain-containing protein [Klebsiella variicola]|uniref:KilA-N domain-containing protein n=1 Tax=Klebsiella variicola TaxID=244366 RepID=UPI00396C6780